MILQEHYPKDMVDFSYRKLWDINLKLLNACKEGKINLAEIALSEGASLLVTNSKGKPGLVSLMENADPIHALSTFMAFDPSLQLLEKDDQYLLAVTPGARRNRGANGDITSFYLDSPKTNTHFRTPIQPENVNEKLLVHFLTLRRFRQQVALLHRELESKSLIPTTLRWPNSAEYKIILQAGFQQSSKEIKE